MCICKDGITNIFRGFALLSNTKDLYIYIFNLIVKHTTCDLISENNFAFFERFEHKALFGFELWIICQIKAL